MFSSDIALVGGCGIVEKLARLREARAVTRAVPRMLGAVVFQRTSKMRATRHGRCEQSYHRLYRIERKLRMKYTA